MGQHTPERLHSEITDGTFCENCGSGSDTFMRSELEEKVERWQACVNALAGIPDPAAWVKAARTLAHHYELGTLNRKAMDAFRAADRPDPTPGAGGEKEIR